METARGGMIRSGLGYRRCNVAACLNVSSDHLGLRGVDTLEQLAVIKRVPIEIAKDAAVLNADDPLCLQMADYTEAERVCYVTMNPSHALVKQHIRAGGEAFVLEQALNGHMIAIYDGETHTPLLWTHLIPATIEGRAMHNVQNAMFAAALAYNMGISLEDIRHGLRTFDSTFFQAPGRMNIYDEHPFKVILDYAHNAAAVKAICDLVDRFDVEGRKIVVLAAPGDRRDEDIRDIAEIAAGHFDHYICRRDDNTRGRDGDEVPTMLKDKLLEKDIPIDAIEVIPDEQEATRRALEMADTGDLVLILGDNVKRTWKQIIYFNSGAHADDAAAKTPVTIDLPETDDFTFDSDIEIISDERGVRIAREEAD
jgi:cyanophycin synthetase